MRRFCFLPMVLLLLVAGNSLADRLPLQRTKTGPLAYELKPWETRVDPKPRVVNLGKGKYGFRFLGFSIESAPRGIGGSHPEVGRSSWDCQVRHGRGVSDDERR